MSIVLGIDGGGSKTIALLADEAGQLLGRGSAGPSNYQSVGVDAARTALVTASTAAFQAAQLPITPPAAIALGLAGVDRPADHALVARWASSAWPGVPVMIVNDAALVLAAGCPAGWGVALICGTGSIAYGESPDGEQGRAGGWGHILGDEGSGYAIGLAGLRAIVRAADGRAPQTQLTALLLGAWQLATPEALVDRVYRQGVTPDQIAALAGLVEQAAQQQDEVAQQIITTMIDELVIAIGAVVHQLHLPQPTPCALAGGFLVHRPRLADQIPAVAARRGLALAPVVAVLEPAQGAIRLAHQLLVKDV